MLNKVTKLLLIKNGEQQQVLYFSALFFFIGAGMAIGRGASETLFFKRFGIEYLPYMYIITSLTLCLISLLYAAFVDRIPAEKFYKVLFSILAILLTANWYASLYLQSDLVYPAFFLLYEVASELLLIHCAVYLTQNLVQTQSKRLTPIILSGFQVGVITGGLLLAIGTPHLGVANMMLIWVFLLISSFVLLSRWHLKKGVSPYFRAGKKSRSGISQSMTQITQGVKLMRSSKLLRMSSLSLFFLVIAVYILAFAVNTVYAQHFTSEESLSSFFGLLTATTGIIALLIQLLLTNRLIQRFGIKKVNYIFPLSSIFSYIILLIGFTLPAAIIGSLNKESLMPAFAKPVRNIFNASLPEKIQGRAQAIAVIAVIPLGLACAGAFLLLSNTQDNINYFLSAGLLCSFALLYFNCGINAAYAKEILSNLKNRLFIPDQKSQKQLNKNPDYLLKDIEKGLMSSDESISYIYVKALINIAPDIAAHLLSQRLKTASTRYKDKTIRLLHSQKILNFGNKQVSKLLENSLGTGDKHLDATLLHILFQLRHSEEKNRLPALLTDNNPRLRATGIHGIFSYAETSLINPAISEWKTMICSPEIDTYMPAMELIIPSFKHYYHKNEIYNTIKEKLIFMLNDNNERVINTALKILTSWNKNEITELDKALRKLICNDHWTVRNNSLNINHLLDKNDATSLLISAIDDRHPAVRKNALNILIARQKNDITFIQNLFTNNPDCSLKTKRTMLEYLLLEGGNPATLQKISISLANDAVDLYHRRKQFKYHNKKKNTAATILLHALDERIYETADLALYATQSSDTDSEIAIIRAGLTSMDKRQFSNACELLSMLSNHQLVTLILPLFDDTADYHKTEHRYSQSDSLVSVLHWIQSNSDVWLKECASYFIEKENVKQHV